MKISLWLCGKYSDYEISIVGDSVTFERFIPIQGEPAYHCRYEGATPSDDLHRVHIDGERYTVTNPEYLKRQIPDDWNDRHLIRRR